MKESGVNLTLTVVDTPGFGDAVDNSGCWDPVTQYVEAQYEAFLDAETRVNRVSLSDGRVIQSSIFRANILFPWFSSISSLSNFCFIF